VFSCLHLASDVSVRSQKRRLVRMFVGDDDDGLVVFAFPPVYWPLYPLHCLVYRVLVTDADKTGGLVLQTKEIAEQNFPARRRINFFQLVTVVVVVVVVFRPRNNNFVL
jgi:hypothetical protein